MTIDIRFTDDPVCRCCNQFMERRSGLIEGGYLQEEELADIPKGDWVCTDCRLSEQPDLSERVLTAIEELKAAEEQLERATANFWRLTDELSPNCHPPLDDRGQVNQSLHLFQRARIRSTNLVSREMERS